MPIHKGVHPPPGDVEGFGGQSICGGEGGGGGGEAEEESKEGLFKANTVNEEGWRRQRGMGRAMSRFKTKSLSLVEGRRDDLDPKEIDYNYNLVPPTDEDVAIFLHVLYAIVLFICD
jgi:hypothetical protein